MYHTIIYALQSAHIQSIISLAIAGLIIPFINTLESGILPSYFSHFMIMPHPNYLFIALSGRMGSSYFYFHIGCVILTAALSIEPKDGIADGFRDNFLTDHIEFLGGIGPKVAAYFRTSKKGQSQFSIGGQTDDVKDLIDKIKPSIIYWFFDEGKSSKSDKDFDKLKINSKILSLKRADKVDELWVSIFDRMGRVSRPMAHFYLDFSEEGGIIRTTERPYTRDDLADFVRDADAAEKANKIRVKAVKNGTLRSWRQKHWNKRGTPLGYVRRDKWLQEAA